MIPETFSIIDTKFKDDSPLNTVARIKGILDSYGIKTIDKWEETGVPGCFSLRVSVQGTSFSSFGKGVTKELAMASGYGELIERMQIGRIFKSDRQKSVGPYSTQTNLHLLPVAELLARNRAWYTTYTEQVQKLTGVTLTEEDLLKQYINSDGVVPSTAFYCVNKKTQEYLPTTLLNAVYTTNGCAAGNTMEEALVQAISEIVERHVSMKILLEGIPVPDVPEDTLRSYPLAYSIINFLRSNNFKVVIKDCSLGDIFPVVCVCLIDQTSGKYYTHFGAYPHFEIALQRTLTETFQSHHIARIARYDNFMKNTGSSYDTVNLISQLVIGSSEKSPEFFINAAVPYTQTGAFKSTSNRELLKECIAFLTSKGHDVLVRNYSCLGFPTYQVIVPGYSEALSHRMAAEHNDARFHKFAQPVLRNPSAATLEEIMGFLVNLSQITKRKLNAIPFSQQANLPLQLSIDEEGYMMEATMAHLNYTLGRNRDAVKYIDRMLTRCAEKDISSLICLKRYLTFRADGYSEEQIRTVLNYFHDPDVVQNLLDAIENKQNPLNPFTLHCDGQCDPSCILRQSCTKEQTDALAQIINSKMKELNPADLKSQFEQLSL